MNITKIETNYKNNLFLKESKITEKKYKDNIENKIINIYPDITYNTFYAFGAAITESSAYAYSLLPKDKKDNFINEHFNSNYNILRISVASCDFSLKSYSYSKKDDLSDFSIENDYKYIIPMLKDILNKNPNISFLASPWSPPKFMKNTKMLTLGGKLLNKYKQTYANYLVKFINEYKKEGINISFITVQNEPNAVQTWESCLYSSEEEIEFVKNYLYPTFKSNNIQTKIIIWDHNKEKLFLRAKAELNSEDNFNAVDGFAFHWYTGDHFENIELLSKEYPGKLLIHTEGCTGCSNFKVQDEVMNAEIYAHDILGDLSHGVNYYIDWNILLDNHGGPNHKGNYCNSPCMLNKDNSDYIKNLTQYYIKHFSKYIKPNAKRIAFSKYTDFIEIVAFKNNNNSIIVVLLNKTNINKEYNLVINNNFFLHDNLDSHAIVTYEIKL